MAQKPGNRILVTGATGFVGRVLCRSLADAGYRVRAALRRDGVAGEGVAEKCVVGDISGVTDWRSALRDIDAVIHLAARVHILGSGPQDSEQYMETNARGTRCLAQAAVRANIRRLIFLSTVKVHGEEAL